MLGTQCTPLRLDCLDQRVLCGELHETQRDPYITQENREVKCFERLLRNSLLPQHGRHYSFDRCDLRGFTDVEHPPMVFMSASIHTSMYGCAEMTALILPQVIASIATLC